MPFDRNQEAFSSPLQYKIWVLGTQLVPIEKTLRFVDEEYKKSCIDLYNFLLAVFEDMYENIEKTGSLPDGIPDNKTDKPLWVLKHFGNFCENIEDNNMVLDTSTYIKKYKKWFKNDLDIINYLIKCHGLVISTVLDKTILSNTKYPDMFRIIPKIGWNLFNCDFRVITKAKIDAFEIITETLGDNQQKIAIKVDELLRSKGLKREKNLISGRIIYRYKKEIISYMYREENRIVVPVLYMDYRNYMSFEELCSKLDIYDNSEDLKEFAFINTKKCTFCSGKTCNKYIEYKNRKKRICSHLGGVYFREFDEKNMMYMELLIDLKINCYVEK